MLTTKTHSWAHTMDSDDTGARSTSSLSTPGLPWSQVLQHHHSVSPPCPMAPNPARQGCAGLHCTLQEGDVCDLIPLCSHTGPPVLHASSDMGGPTLLVPCTSACPKQAGTPVARLHVSHGRGDIQPYLTPYLTQVGNVCPSPFHTPPSQGRVWPHRPLPLVSQRSSTTPCSPHGQQHTHSKTRGTPRQAATCAALAPAPPRGEGGQAWPRPP